MAFGAGWRRRLMHCIEREGQSVCERMKTDHENEMSEMRNEYMVMVSIFSPAV